MSKLSVIRDTIAGNYGKPFDHEFKNRVQEIVISARVEAMRRYMDKEGFTDNFIHQIDCTPTQKVDIAECCNVDLECNITRTKFKMPKPIRTTKFLYDYQYVGSIDGMRPFGYIRPEQIPYMLKTRNLGKSIRWTRLNDYIYIFNGNPPQIRLRGAIANPFELVNLEDCSGNNCIDDIDISDDITTVIYKLSYELLNIRVEETQLEQKETKLNEQEN